MKAEVRGVALSWCALLCAGCSLGVGPSATGQAWSDGVVSPGVRANARFHPLGSESLTAGTEWEIGDPARQLADEWRGSFLLGYSHMPLPHTSAVGWEATAVVGGSRMHLRQANPGAFHLGPTLGLPFRLAPSDPPWRAANDFPEWLVVPEVSALTLFPLGNFDHSPRLELSLAITLRTYLWWNVFP